MNSIATNEKKKRYRARVLIGMDIKGKKLYTTPSAYTRKELDAKVAEIKSIYSGAIEIVKPYQSRKPYFRVYAEEWYRLFKEPFLRESTQNMYLNILHNHLYPEFGKMELAAITPVLMQRFILRYKDSSKSLVTKIQLTLKQILASAHEDGLLDRNPTKRLRPPQGTEGERRPLPMGSVKTLVTQARNHPDGLLPILLVLSGLRRGEALALRWEDVDETTIHVRRAVVFNDRNNPTVGEPKTKSALRSIRIMFEPLKEVLRGRGEGYVFGGDAPWTYTKYVRTWERLQRDIPVLQGISAHVLRHTFTMLLRRGNVDGVTAQYLLGHSDYETTANIYTHIVDEDMNDAHAKLDKAMLHLFEDGGDST